MAESCALAVYELRVGFGFVARSSRLIDGVCVAAGGLVAASVLAINPTNGAIKWGYQYTPNDPYDFDEISEHPIINAKINGEDRKLVVHAARNGFYYALDRTNGSFILGKQYVDQLNWTTGLDPKTGLPLNYNPNTDVQEYSPKSHGSRANPKAA